MTDKLDVYKCEICGNIIQVLLAGAGTLVCCGQDMNKLKPRQDELEELGEKHIPIFESDGGAKFITLRKHPMIPEHYIQFIAAYNADKSEMRLKYLYPEQEAAFNITGMNGELNAIEYCNVHGLWGNSND